ncbi:alpha/beta fold hydrolase [Flavivirga spongiicola]|uniref:Alpha/beta hydrolase n=1 Tax=Flavivirga spongiicola TaxID=421621 RepID=A0ABU7XRZ3_9FLAO|nr:alpha/beta hydrolase [Flavivirga sp. MEBiC05379]MDO5978522.1 alpha/beta hydrolase [Flavivirga sp. MEBiC05379]
MNLLYKGINVFYTDKGKGNAIVLLHGFLENVSMWDTFIPTLSKKNRVICIDLLGHGKTECLGYIHTMELMAEIVQAILKHLKIRRSTFIGHSMGGYVALAYAEKNPDALKGLCLMNSTASADTLEKKKNRDRAIIAVKQNHKRFIRMAISNLFRPKNRIIFSEKIKQLKKEALKTPLQGIVASLEGMKIRKDREALLHFTPFKKMLMISRKDPVLDYNTLISQTKNTDVEVVEFPDGHMSHIENEREFLRTIVHFIENI